MAVGSETVSPKIPVRLFTDAEIEQHRDRLDIITNTGADYLDEIYADHLAFFDKYGVSKYFGNRRRDYQTRDGRIKALQSYGKPPNLADLQVGTACILLAMQSLERGFGAAGMADTWRKINNVLKIDNAFLGTDLQIMLQQLGWKIYYWNPNPTKNAQWDEEDRRIAPLAPGRKWQPVWGGHAARYNTVMEQGTYSGKRVDNAVSLVGFGTNPPASFRNVPLFIGTAHDGYHVFPGRRGDVVEAHSMRNLNARDNIEISRFNPLAAGGGPRWTNSEKYRSGLIAVPVDF